MNTKEVLVWILAMSIHIGVTVWLYYFAVDILERLTINESIACLLVFIVHMLLILVYNGCPLTYVLDHHVLEFFGVDSGKEEYGINEMWLVQGLRWIGLIK